jgi:asparagine synthase (glutamine-hydrolysing)
MSAIFGIYSKSGYPVSDGALELMSETLAHRGTDAFGIWSGGQAGLGQRMLWTTRESVGERLPLSNADGNLCIVADARLDNRAELLRALNLPSAMADGEIILAAYEAWGEECPVRLLGDFAFAVWDGRRRILFCARDHFGIKPLYYYQNEDWFVVATELKGVLCHPDVPRRINDSKIADYLLGTFLDKEDTYFEGVLRLPPGSSLSVGRGHAKVKCYWALDPSRETRFKSDGEYAEAFREIFTEAVRCRLRSQRPVRTMLSGGLDSTSITCVARDLTKGENLDTFSIVFDTVHECDERKYINDVLAAGGLKSNFLPGDDIGPLNDLEKVFWHMDGPFWAPGLYLAWATYAAAQASGFRVILDGHDGDTAVSHGYKYLNELAAAGSWYRLAREAKGIAPVFRMPALKILYAHFNYYKIKPLISAHPSLKLGRRALRRLLPPKAKRSAGAEPPNLLDLVNPDFAQSFGLSQRYQASRKSGPGTAADSRTEHYRALNGGLQPMALEVHDSAAAAFSVEARYPFFDRRLLEFCLSLPGDQKLSRGFSRVVMRRAMSGVIPDSVMNRKDKTTFNANLFRGMVNQDSEKLRYAVHECSALLEGYVDMEKIREAYARFTSYNSPDSTEARQDMFAVWRVASLALWLKQSSEQKLVAKGGDRDVKTGRAQLTSFKFDNSSIPAAP